MKRWVCIAMALMLMLCGCTATAPASDSDQGGQTLPTSAPVKVPIGERTGDGVKVTIHAGLLGVDSEVLSEEQKANGFLEGVRNTDGSVTYTIDSARYDTFVQDKLAKTKTAIDETVRGNFPSVTGITYEEDLSAITVTVNRANYEYSVDSLVVFAVGTLAITEQAYDLDAPGICVVTVLDEQGDEVSRTVYPDELVL